MTNSLDEIADANTILIIGSNTTESHPVASLRVKEAVRRGANLIVIDPRPIEVAEAATHWLQPLPGTNVAVLQGMMNHILSARLWNMEFVDSRTEGFTDFAASLDGKTPEWAASVSGVDADLIRAAAEAYATAERSTILYAMGVTQHSTGTDGVLTLANLAMLTGQIGRPGTGVNPLRGQNNVQGSSDMGALFDTLPGYRKVTDSAARAALAEAWGLAGAAADAPQAEADIAAALPAVPGAAASELPDRIMAGEIRALYLMGENIALTDPDVNHTRKALTNLEFLVVQDLFLTETAAFADVILPACSWAEKEGTFTNTERRVQRFYQAIQPLGESRPDWQIIVELSNRLGYPMNYGGPQAIMAEIAATVPQYGGIAYGRLGEAGLQWPCPTPDHPGTPILHREKFTRGLGRFSAVTFKPSAELPDAEFPFVFTTGRSLYHYHSGSMTRRARPLAEHRPDAYAEMDPATASQMGLKDGDLIRVTSRRGEVTVPVRLVPGTGSKVIFMPFHFREASANLLTNTVLDPVARIPELKVCAVRVEVAQA